MKKSLSFFYIKTFIQQRLTLLGKFEKPRLTRLLLSTFVYCLLFTLRFGGFTVYFFLPTPVFANCPICIVTVGGGLLIAEKLGIDPLLVSIWISGLNSALAYWMADGFSNKLKSRSDQPLRSYAILCVTKGGVLSIIFYLFTLLYLYLTKQIGAVNHRFLGIDKTVFGLTVGLAIFIGSNFLDKFLRSKNNGKVMFPYQKVILPFCALLLATLGFKIFI